MELHVAEWVRCLNRVEGRTGVGRNKLRTYRLFKHDYIVEPYCTIILPLKHRSAFAKFRCGVAPLRLETGRYEHIAENERVCPFCIHEVEDELHALLKCREYCDIRHVLTEKANTICPEFNDLTDIEKMKSDDQTKCQNLF